MAAGSIGLYTERLRQLLPAMKRGRVCKGGARALNARVSQSAPAMAGEAAPC